MSRIAAYIGPPVPLGEFLIKPRHSLFQQARKPDELQQARPNADGFGLGWYLKHSPQRYIQTCPIWNDPNLGALASSLSAPLWLGSVRSAGNEFGVIPANTQPFHGGDMLFMHNGFIADFNQVLRPACLQYLSPETAAGIQGNTDSEYLFALLRQRLTEPDHLDPGDALLDVLANLEVSLKDYIAVLNLIISDGRRLIGTRHAINQACPRLFYCEDDESFSPGARLMATEPLTDSPCWREVPERHMLLLEQDKPAQLIHL